MQLTCHMSLNSPGKYRSSSYLVSMASNDTGEFCFNDDEDDDDTRRVSRHQLGHSRSLLSIAPCLTLRCKFCWCLMVLFAARYSSMSKGSSLMLSVSKIFRIGMSDPSMLGGFPRRFLKYVCHRFTRSSGLSAFSLEDCALFLHVISLFSFQAVLLFECV